jgi:hypothetical protein
MSQKRRVIDVESSMSSKFKKVSNRSRGENYFHS